MKLRVIEAAQNEMIEEVLFLEARQQGLGARFLDEVEWAKTIILENPYTAQSFSGKFRRLGLKKFPFGIWYRILDPVIEIVAVAHDRRRPGYWRDRLPSSH